MKPLLILFVMLCAGCAAVPAVLPAWWTANKVYLFEAGAAAGAATQIEQFGLSTKQVADEVWKK